LTSKRLSERHTTPLVYPGIQEFHRVEAKAVAAAATHLGFADGVAL
jgi:hypothetical protein